MAEGRDGLPHALRRRGRPAEGEVRFAGGHQAQGVRRVPPPDLGPAVLHRQDARREGGALPGTPEHDLFDLPVRGEVRVLPRVGRGRKG